MATTNEVIRLTLEQLKKLLPLVDNPDRLISSTRTLDELGAKYNESNPDSTIPNPPGDPIDDLESVIRLVFEAINEITPTANDTEETLIISTSLNEIVDGVAEWINIYDPDNAAELLEELRAERDKSIELLVNRLEVLIDEIDSTEGIAEAAKSVSLLINSKVRITEYEKLWHFLNLLNHKVDSIDDKHTEISDGLREDVDKNRGDIDTNAANHQSHLDDVDNPHVVTKAQVGLGSVPNYPATSSLTDGSESKFATAKATKDLKDEIDTNDSNISNREIATSAPLQGGGDLSADRTLSILTATTGRTGSVQLSDEVDDTSVVKAATANAVKKTYDHATDADDNANTKVSKSGDTMTGNLSISRSDDNHRYFGISRVRGGVSYESRYSNRYIAATIDYIVDGTIKSSLRLDNTLRVGEGDPDVLHRVYSTNYKPYCDRWTDARTITFTGDVAGDLSIRGDANVTAGIDVKQLDGVPANYVIYGDGGSGSTQVTSMNGVSKSGFYRINGGDDGPVSEPGGGWFWFISSGHTASGKYGLQLSTENSGSSSRYWLRTRISDGTSGWTQIYTTRHKPTKADVGLSNVDNVKQLPYAGGTIIHTVGYLDIYRYSEGTHGSPDFEGGYLRSYVTFTAIEGRALWQFSTRSDELGSATPQLPIDIKLGSNYVYHGGRKPTAADVGALPISGGTMTGTIKLKNDNIGIADHTGKRLIAGDFTNEDDVVCKVGHQTTHDRLGLHAKNVDGFYVHATDKSYNIYHEGNKPSKSDVGLSNVDNAKQVRLIGNNRITEATSFIIDGNADTTSEDNKRGVFRITPSETDTFGTNGAIYIQAGPANSVSSSAHGALVLAGYYGGSLEECNIKLREADKLTTTISGSSTRHSVYHEGNKPNAGDVEAIPTTRAARVAGVNPNDLWEKSGIYSISNIDFDDEDNPHSGTWDATLFVIANVNQADQWLCPSRGNIYHRVDDNNPVTGDGWSEWYRVYTSIVPPTAEEVKALPISGGALTGPVQLIGGANNGIRDVHSNRVISQTNENNGSVVRVGDKDSTDIVRLLGKNKTSFQIWNSETDTNRRIYHEDFKPSKSDVGLSNVDNVKQAHATRKINTNSPLSGGGDLSADRTLSVADSSTSAKGVVQLSDATNSTSTALAATANAVKKAYDRGSSGITKADAAQASADSHIGNKDNPHGVTKAQIGLSNVNNWTATSSETDGSESKYATAAAVKKVNDKVGTGDFLPLSGGTLTGTLNSRNINATGSITATGTISADSDLRLKENIAPIQNALDKVLGIRGVTFNFKEADVRSAGVIAQEVEEVLPEVVHNNQRGFKTVAYGNMNALLIEAIKELKGEVDALKSELAVVKDGNV